MSLVQIILATFLVSLTSLVGILTLFFKEKFLNKILLILISFSIGALLGGAFLHLIPEAIEHSGNIFIFVIGGFLLFFIIEKLFHWRHCHKNKCSVHSFAYVNLLGDVIHNFIDGVIIAAGFAASSIIGASSSAAIAIHEIPQELGDFGVLVYAGFSKRKALFFNFLTALSAIFGGVIGFYLLSFIEGLMPFLLSSAAGGFIYIAASDLIPEIKKFESIKSSLINFIAILIGILIIYLLRFIGS
ncbi:MAG: ZIP family metal transporter [Candidatus Pacearchaeota archaeon]